jgi:hypothetical protein
MNLVQITELKAIITGWDENKGTGWSPTHVRNHWFADSDKCA